MHMLANPTEVKLDPEQVARLSRLTVRGATMGRLLRSEGNKAPLATRVRTACCHDGAPLVQFSKKETQKPMTLLLENVAAGLSVGVQGMVALADPQDIERFYRRHTDAEATDASLAVFRMDVQAVYAETDEGGVRWVDRDGYILNLEQGDLAEAEAGSVEHVNGGHPDTIHAVLSHRGLGADDWVMTGADPEGIDVARGSHSMRIAFDTPVYSRETFKKMLIRLRAISTGTGKPTHAATAE
jgi:hypothetical protein